MPAPLSSAAPAPRLGPYGVGLPVPARRRKDEGCTRGSKANGSWSPPSPPPQRRCGSGGIAGCASDNGNTDADYVKVCKDPATGERVEDKKCDDDTGPASHSHPHWVYMPISRGSSVSAPGVGQKVPSGYSDSKPSSSSKVTTSDRSGGSYSRGSGTRHGGFGSGSKGGSGS